MKKFFAVLTMAGSLSLGMVSSMQAQDTDIVMMSGEEESLGMADKDTADVAVQGGVSEVLMSGWTEGDASLMFLVVVSFVLGLVCCIERIVSLGLSDIDTRKLLEKIGAALEKGDVEGATNLCRNTRGPIAAVCGQGLMRIDDDLDTAERMVALYRDVQTDMLKKKCRWVSMFLWTTLALGVLGTAMGVVIMLEQLQYGGSFSVFLLAEGIKTALFPLVFGLLSAVILYLFDNYIRNKAETLANRMKAVSITLFDLMMKYNWKYKR